MRPTGLGEQVQDLPDGPVATDRLTQWPIALGAVAVATAFLLLDDVAGVSQLGDYSVGAAFGDVGCGRDVAQAHTGIVGDDTLNGDANHDTLNGDAGNDSLFGPNNDGSSDTLNGGADADTCQTPLLLDLLTRDSLTSCNP